MVLTLTSTMKFPLGNICKYFMGYLSALNDTFSTPQGQHVSPHVKLINVLRVQG